mgnify:CR=1 FL=1
MIKIPTDQNNRWTQPNNSDKFGSLWATKNINLDEEGYIKLSPRSILLADEATSNFGVPVNLHRISSGEYLIPTFSDAVFNVSISTTAFGNDENTGTGNPTLVAGSHSVFFGNLLYASTDTGLLHRVLSTDHTVTWTAASGVSATTTGKRHYLCVFESRASLCITNGNTVVQYTSDFHATAPTHTASTTLTIPSDFEIIGLAHNNERLGIITRLGSSTAGQNKQAYFFVWNGSTTGATSGFGVGSDQCLGICPYKFSFAVLTRAGQLLYWNGGGFEVLANFPFYYSNQILGGGSTIFLNNFSFGNNMEADGDIIYLNVPNTLDPFTRKSESIISNFPAGVWCFDPKIGLYHRYSGSISPKYVNSVTSGNVSVDNDNFTLSSGTIPATGNICRVTSGATGAVGFKFNQDYFIIKSSSTVFKLAATKEKALAGVALDITTAPSDTTVFWMYDLLDYGTTLSKLRTAVVAQVGETLMTHSDIFIGGDYYNTSLTGKNSLCVSVPHLENRGWFILPKIFSSQITDKNQKFFVKFRPLKSTDSIVIKYRNKDIEGLPTISFGSGASAKAATWTSDDEFYSQQDLSEAKTYLDAGGELECEFIAGVGGGQAVQISSISTDDSITYSVILAESVIGAAATLKSEFIIQNWKVLRTVTSTDSDILDNTAIIPIGGASKFSQFKVELRGSDVSIEEVGFINTTNQKAE